MIFFVQIIFAIMDFRTILVAEGERVLDDDKQRITKLGLYLY